MKINKFIFLLVLIISCNIFSDNISKNIRINQIGYVVNSPKIFIVVNAKADKFNIQDTSNNIVYTGKLVNFGIYNESKENIKIGDFSDFNVPGEYLIKIDKLGLSYSFKIDKGIYQSVLKASVKSYYYQRASMKLDKTHAGKWFRDAGHIDTNLIFHGSSGRKGIYSSPGGWYDAGDYGKYIVNAGISVCTLLSLYELYPNTIKDDLNIPESNNEISDLLDEVKYEIDWMKTMQDTDGGVFFKIGPLKWPEFVMPNNDLSPRYIIGKSTASTLNFCAVMAQAGRIYKNIDLEYSEDCLKKAIDAWIWAKKNPKVTHPNEKGGTGLYIDSVYDDEFFWAASELFITTENDEYKDYIQKNIDYFKIIKQAKWNNVSNLGIFSLATIENNISIEVKNKIKQYVINYSNKLEKDIISSGYRIPLKENDFIWGSNGEIGNYGVILCYAYILTKDKKYLDLVIMILDYIFGKNAMGYSFVTGYGKKIPLNIHHRPSGADYEKYPVPGFIVGGPNYYREDNLNYSSYSPAKCYLDLQDSYASNEICINWNASLIFLLGIIEQNLDIYSK